MLSVGNRNRAFHVTSTSQKRARATLNSSTLEILICLDFIFHLRAGLTPSSTNDCKKAALAPPLAHHQGGKPWPKIDDVLMFFLQFPQRNR
jgi:hypothetical protein